MLQVGILVIAVNSWAIAQEAGISDFTRDLSGSQGVYGSINTPKDFTLYNVNRTGHPDTSDRYARRTPYPASYAIALAKTGYFRTALPGGGDFANVTQNRFVTTSRIGETRPRKNSAQATKFLSWETGEGKSYIIPALEIPTFLVLLNMYDRVVYPHEMEDGEKIIRHQPLNLLGKSYPRALGG